MTGRGLQTSDGRADAQSWGLLFLLSVIWGGSFFFIGIAVKELPALLIVLARVGLAAILLVPLHYLLQGPLPKDRKSWIAFAGMSILNNVIPFTAISWGQHHIASGLASVINATTPMFAAAFMAIAGLEGLTTRKTAALALGLVGVIVLRGTNLADVNGQSLGILAVATASASYGLSAVWAKRRLVGIPPMTTATGQLVISAVLMTVLSAAFSDPALYWQVSSGTWIALVTLAVLSTSLAYLIFFRIIARAGPSFVSLVTMLVPVTAIILGHVFLGERFGTQEFAGTALIGLALLIIDGRILKLFRHATT